MLIRLQQPGNDAAWREFADLYEPLILRLAQRKGLQDADARDLLQDVMVVISKAIERLELGPGKGRFRGWLCRIVRNLIFNALKKQGRLVLGSGDSRVWELLLAEPQIDQHEKTAYRIEFRRELFRWAVRIIEPEFQPTTWSLFWRTSVQGETIAAVAEEMRISIGSAYTARCRVLARLRRQIADLDVNADDDLHMDGHDLSGGSDRGA